jgi:hypothetical protein
MVARVAEIHVGGTRAFHMTVACANPLGRGWLQEEESILKDFLEVKKWH